MTKTANKPNIHQRLVAVRSEVAGIGKDARNKFQGFDYVSHSKVMARIRALMDKHGIALTSRITNKAYETYQDKKGARQMLIELDVEYTFVNVDDPVDSIVLDWYSQGTDAGERCVGKALSYSNKYFLLSQFLVPTDRDDPDASDLPGQQAESDPTKAPMSKAQKGELQTLAKQLFGDGEYAQATKDICLDGGVCNFPPATISDYALLKAELGNIKVQQDVKAGKVKKAAEDTFNG